MNQRASKARLRILGYLCKNFTHPIGLIRYYIIFLLIYHDAIICRNGCIVDLITENIMQVKTNLKRLYYIQ